MIDPPIDVSFKWATAGLVEAPHADLLGPEHDSFRVVLLAPGSVDAN